MGKKLDQENIQIVLVESDSTLSEALQQSVVWEVSFKDVLSVILYKKYVHDINLLNSLKSKLDIRAISINRKILNMKAP